MSCYKKNGYCEFCSRRTNLFVPHIQDVLIESFKCFISQQSEWTTEKEINVFSDFNISGDITQTIKSGSLVNYIPFRKGGGFGVQGSVIPDENLGERTNFKFESASIDLGWLKFSIPPLGEGWFDTIYLDDDLRVDVNSRDDILICTPL